MAHVGRRASVFSAQVILVRWKRTRSIRVIKRSAVGILREDREVWAEMALNFGEKLVLIQNAGGFIRVGVYVSDGSRRFRYNDERLRGRKRRGRISRSQQGNATCCPIREGNKNLSWLFEFYFCLYLFCVRRG